MSQPQPEEVDASEEALARLADKIVARWSSRSGGLDELKRRVGILATLNETEK